MPSNIKYQPINENFPAVGEDNDTQVFRDNFDSIKTALRVANEELTDLQDNVTRNDQDNDLNRKLIQNATLVNNVEKIIPSELPISSGSISIEFGSAPYQVFEVSDDTAIDFNGFPITSDSVGKVTIELYSDGSARNISFTTSGTTVFKKSSNFPQSLTVSSSTDSVIIEAWQYSSSIIFLNYKGTFS
jgi:hypothetical protein